MTETVHIKPAAGRLVRIPDTYEVLSPQGKAVEMNSYWLRKQSAGDIEVDVPEDQAQKPKGDK